MSNNSLGRNEPKLNFLANKKYIDLIELADLASVDFTREPQNLYFNDESTSIWKNNYFKIGLLLLILSEWLIRKFKELR